MTRAFNFSPGPATIPEEVLRQAADEMLDWRGTGMSVMEMSHRSADYAPVIREAEADLRELLGVPSHYKVLFMQGGALAENAIVPLNMLRGRGVADYVDTGIWSTKSINEARRFGTINVIASAKADGYTRIPAQSEWQPTPGAAYVHICGNETIGGVEYQWTPDAKAAYGNDDTPLVADVSSHILSRPLDVTRYGLVFGGAQKNVSMAGLTFVIVRDDLIGQAHPHCPSAFDYKVVADNDSMFNTPPTYAIYLAGLVFKWLKARPARDRAARPVADAGDRIDQYREVHDAVRRARCVGVLQRTRREGRPLADERHVFPSGRRIDDEVRGRRRGRGPQGIEGTSRGRRHPRVDLQRDAEGRRRSARGVHARVRTRARLTIHSTLE